MYKIALEYHDAGVTHPIGPRMWDILESFRQHYPNFKVTLFTVPYDLRHGKAIKSGDPEYKNWVKIANKAYEQGWCRFALHGFNHVEREFENLTYEQAAKRILFGTELFKKLGLPIDPLFIAPNWFISSEAERAVTDAGFKVLKDRYYNWNLKDSLPRPAEFGDKVIIGHGHIQDADGCNNGLSETKHRVLQIPTDAEFIHLIDAINERPHQSPLLF